MYIKYNQDISDTYTSFIDELINITSQNVSVHLEFVEEIKSHYPQMLNTMVNASKRISSLENFTTLDSTSPLKTLVEYSNSLTAILDRIPVESEKMNYLYQIGPEEFPRIIQPDLIDSQELFEYTVAREKNCQALRKHNSTMNALFIYSTGLFEKFISDIIKHGFKNNQTARDRYNRSFIKFAQKMDGESGNKYMGMLLNSNRKNSKTIAAYNEYVSNTPGGYWKLIEYMYDSDKRLRNHLTYKILQPYIREIQERRNLLIHRGTRADEKYYKSIRDSKASNDADYSETLSSLFQSRFLWPNLELYGRTLLYGHEMPAITRIRSIEGLINPLDDYYNDHKISAHVIKSHPDIDLTVNSEYLTSTITSLAVTAGLIFLTAFQSRTEKHKLHKWHITEAMNKVYKYMYDELDANISSIAERIIFEPWWVYWQFVFAYAHDEDTGPLPQRLTPDFEAEIIYFFSLMRAAEQDFFQETYDEASQGIWEGGADGLLNLTLETLLRILPKELATLVTASLYSSEELLEACKKLKDPIPDDLWEGLTFGTLYKSPIFSYHLEDPDIVSFFQELSQSNQGVTSKHGK